MVEWKNRFGFQKGDRQGRLPGAHGIEVPDRKADQFGAIEVAHEGHAGDTNVFSDMALVRDLYRPELVCLPIGDLYTMGPREAALAVTFLEPKTVLPLHHGTFPALTGTPEAFSRLISGKSCRMVSVRPGETFTP